MTAPDRSDQQLNLPLAAQGPSPDDKTLSGANPTENVVDGCHNDNLIKSKAGSLV
jgi:hypothetical protein